MVRRTGVGRWPARSAAAVTAAAALVVPLAITGASAHPGHGGESDPEGSASVLAADDPALDWNNYDKVKITGDTGEPIGMAVLPDEQILHTARDGVVRLTDPATGLTEKVAELDVYRNSEDGLQGIALDPDFEENNWVYTMYAPTHMSGETDEGIAYPEQTPQGSAPEELPEGEDESYWDQWLGYNVLSRFKFDPEEGTFDLDSEEEILKVTAQRGQCCHVGADIAFDNDGNLFLSTGDNTPADAPGSDAYTPINNAPGMNPGFDSRRGAGNTNDLRGAILRISVLDEIEEGAEPGEGTTYTIPEGNFFDSLDDPEAYPEDKVRDEIYIFGLRNPFRMTYDPVADALAWGEYGPDAPNHSDERGPMGYVEWQVASDPIAGGWPYCHGPNDGGAYNEWDFENEEPGEFFDCAAPVNNSTWNTGVVDLPATTEPQIWYGNDPGDQPEEWDGLVTFTEGRGQAPMGGPIFRYDDSNESVTQFPEFWDGMAFMGEFSQDYVAAFEMDEMSTEGEVTEIYNFLPNDELFEQAADEWSGIIDMEFGPDGSLYILEYGKGFFRENPEAGVYRIDYSEEGNKTPRAVINADPIAGSEAPLEVTFDASDSINLDDDEITYTWDFNGDGEIDAEGVEVTHTYDELGQFTAVLHATDSEGRVGLAVQEITVGNTAPELSIDVDDGSIFSWGDSVDFSVSVTDAEDGDVPDCDRMSWTFGLGHDEHAHPLETGTGCEFTIDTQASAENHGEGEKIFGTLVVQYEDQPQGDVPSVTGEETLTLKPALQEAEWYDASTGGSRQTDSSASAGVYIGGLEEGETLTFEPMAMTHAPSGEDINQVDVRARGEGTISLTWEDDSSPFATFDFTDGDEWQTVSASIDEQPEGSGSVVVGTTGGVDLDSIEFLVAEQPDRVTVPADEVSIQMFSLIPWVDEDGQETVLNRLGEIGLENIEPYGGNFSGLSAEEFREQADAAGLSVPSSHFDVDEDGFDETLEFVGTVGQEYVGSGGFPAPGIDSYEDTLATAEAMNRLGESAVDAGFEKFFGHNHDQEFTTTYEHDGQEMSAWEILVAETDPQYVTFEVDVAWAAHAGVDVAELIEQHGDRIELLHIKDATDLGGESPDFANLGEGDVPLQDILVAAQDAPIAYYVMEYDMAEEGEEFAVTGFEYLTGLEAGEPGEPSEPVEVTPEDVTFTDEPGTENDTFTVPEVEGVQYLVDGEVIDAGTHPGQGLVTVTAEAEEGYVLAEGATTEWSHEFSTDGEDPSEEEPTDPPQEPGTPGDDLPDTGTDIGIYAALAAVLLVAGVSTALTVRRRRV